MQTVTLKLTIEPGLTDIVFPPTRSRVTGVKPKQDLSADDASLNALQAMTVVEATEFVGVHIKSSDRVRCLLELAYEGEPLRRHIEIRPLEPPWMLAVIPKEYYESYLKARRQKAVDDPTGRQQFFYDLDRQTNSWMIPCTDLPSDRRKSLLKSCDMLREPMQKCYADRWDSVAPKPLALDDPLIPHLEIVSDVFLETSKQYSRTRGFCQVSWDAVGELFCDFASGDVQDVILAGKAGGQPQPWTISDVDSAAVFMFAELAAAAKVISRHNAMWEALFPSFVKMQSCYILRFLTFNYYRLMDYDECPESLSPCIRRQIDKLYEGISLYDLDGRINRNLHMAATSL